MNEEQVIELRLEPELLEKLQKIAMSAEVTVADVIKVILAIEVQK
jgi:hypothetical protein